MVVMRADQDLLMGPETDYLGDMKADMADMKADLGGMKADTEDSKVDKADMKVDQDWKDLANRHT